MFTLQRIIETKTQKKNFELFFIKCVVKARHRRSAAYLSIDPAQELNGTVRTPSAEIAGAIQTLLRYTSVPDRINGNIAELGSRKLWLLEVSIGKLRAADAQLARHAYRNRPQGCVQDAQSHMSYRKTDRHRRLPTAVAACHTLIRRHHVRLRWTILVDQPTP